VLEFETSKINATAIKPCFPNIQINSDDAGTAGPMCICTVGMSLVKGLSPLHGEGD